MSGRHRRGGKRRTQIGDEPLAVGGDPMKVLHPEIPDLSDLSAIMPSHIMQLGFGKQPRRDWRARSYVNIFIAVTDKAIAEYRAGAEGIRRGASLVAAEFVMYLEGLQHFETCINSTMRALRIQAQLREHPESPDLEPLVDRSIKGLLGRYKDQITGLRDSIEHMDERIADGGIAEGAPVMLRIHPDGDSLAIGARRLRFVDLALLLRRLYGLSQSLAALHVPRAPSAE